MGFFSDDEARDAHDQIVNGQHEGKLSHELLGAGAAFAAVHEYEKKQRESGAEVKHSFAKEALAALAGAEVDKLVETKGLDFVDREKAKHHARENAEHLYDQKYNN